MEEEEEDMVQYHSTFSLFNSTIKRRKKGLSFKHNSAHHRGKAHNGTRFLPQRFQDCRWGDLLGVRNSFACHILYNSYIRDI